MSRGVDEAAVPHQASQPGHRHLRGAGQGSRFYGDGAHQRAEGGELGAAADVAHQPTDGRQGGGGRSPPVQQQESRRAASLSGNGCAIITPGTPHVICVLGSDWPAPPCDLVVLSQVFWIHLRSVTSPVPVTAHRGRRAEPQALHLLGVMSFRFHVGLERFDWLHL